MYDEQNPAVEWAKTARILGVGLFGLAGFLLSYLIGGARWMQYYGIGLCVLLVLACVYLGIYAIMAMMSRRDVDMAKAFGDLLYAHSQSGAQMAKTVTEVIRGANQINKADADVQMTMMKNASNIGSTYEKRLAELVYQNQKLMQELRVVKEQGLLPGPTEQVAEASFSYMLPDNNNMAYQLPEID